MEHKKVASSNIHSIAYDDGVLEVHYKSGKVYQYQTDSETHERLMKAKSHGAEMHKLKSALSFRPKGEEKWRKP